jgi:hypothetical protein
MRKMGFGVRQNDKHVIPDARGAGDLESIFDGCSTSTWILPSARMMRIHVIPDPRTAEVIRNPFIRCQNQDGFWIEPLRLVQNDDGFDSAVRQHDARRRTARS